MTEKKQKTLKIQNYKNTSNRNVFTEHGRCVPGASVALTSTQAKQYPTLEAVQ